MWKMENAHCFFFMKMHIVVCMLLYLGGKSSLSMSTISFWVLQANLPLVELVVINDIVSG